MTPETALEERQEKEQEWEDQPLPEGVLKIAEEAEKELTLPKTYELDIMADELLGHLTTYKRSRVALRVARSSGDHQRAEQLSKLMVHSRNSAALLQYTHGKELIDLKDTIAKVRAHQAETQRVALLEEIV